MNLDEVGNFGMRITCIGLCRITELCAASILLTTVIPKHE